MTTSNVVHSLVAKAQLVQQQLCPDVTPSGGTDVRELPRGLVTLLPEVDPGAFSGQIQGWKTPRGHPGSVQ